MHWWVLENWLEDCVVWCTTTRGNEHKLLTLDRVNGETPFIKLKTLSRSTRKRDRTWFDVVLRMTTLLRKPSANYSFFLSACLAWKTRCLKARCGRRRVSDIKISIMESLACSQVTKLPWFQCFTFPSPGADQGQRDSDRGRSCLLQNLQCNHLRDQRQWCPGFYPTFGADDTTEHDRKQESVGNLRRPRVDQ